MKNFLLPSLSLFLLLAGCQKNLSVSPETQSTTPTLHVVSRDSLATGSYLGMSVGSEAVRAYEVIQSLQQTKGVTYLNVVSNIASDLTQVRDRLPLYQYILLDQHQGTDSGVQLTIEANRVKSIFLNSGQKLGQWPAALKTASAIRTGDSVSSLYEKLVTIRNLRIYANKFERIFLLTKNLATVYDPVMRQSPQWYFAYSTGAKTMDEVQLHFKNGQLTHFIVNHYQ
ncbi:hypothetical protein GCM10027299_29440 [Larkinella ripae]